MPTYGPYETNRELASGHGSVVYSARKAGESQDNYAVKVFALEEFIGGDHESQAELDPLVAEFKRNFTSSVELQRKAAAVSPHVAPILDVGQDAANAWYATRLYPRTVQKILEGRVALGKEWFHRIILSVARGALDFKQTCGRSHGEIQPSNILISASKKIRDAVVVLSDPLPGDAAEAERYESADLHAIGQVIYQLVRRREVEDATDQSILPLMPSAEWTSVFGKDTEAWLSLCNRLLDPNLALESYNLEKLVAELARLQPKPPVSMKLLAISAVGVLLLGIAVFIAVRMAGRGTLTITSSPVGATIVLDGETLAERTPVKLPRPKGTYDVRAEFPGLDPQSAKVDFRGGRQTHKFVFPHGVIVLESEPAGATVMFGESNLLVGTTAVTTPVTLPPMKPGSVIYQLSLKGYLSTNLPLTIQTGSTTRVKVALTRPPEGQVVVEFDSNPRGAKIELDGKPFATTLETKSLLPGSYTVTGFYKEFWPVMETNLVVQANKEAKVEFYFERGRLNLESDPSGANVFVGKSLVGITPTNMLWPVGPVTFRFEKTGFEPTNLVARLAQDNDRLELQPLLVSTNGIIIFNIDPAPALVLDAATRTEVLRTTPGQPKELMLTPGRHSFLIEAPGYQPITTNILFVTKRKIPVNIRLPAELIPVAFTSDPAGAELFDTATGAPFGSIEKVTRLPASSYKFSARQTRHPALGWVTNDVVVVKGQPNTNVFRFPYTTLAITSSPPDLKVYELLDQARRELIGVTPTNLNFLKPGSITLEFIKWDGTETNRHQFTMGPGLVQAGTYFKPPKPPTYSNSIGLALEWILENGNHGGYWVGKYEVTQEQYQTVMGTNASRHRFSSPATMPVDSVTLADAQEFCRRLTGRDKPLLAQKSIADWVYALPSTNQFNYYAETNLANAVIRKGAPAPITSLATNAFDLCGVRGNLWEWCAEGVARGAAYENGPGIRGNMLDFYYQLVLPANQPSAFSVGFRCVLVPPGNQASR